ncbi:MAG: hypothetical protein CMF11_02000 [Idiomarina sp.]|nr:hypothetical protein [Idiomarina sp.]
MADNKRQGSPLARRIGDRVLRLFQGAPEIIAADYGEPRAIEWSKTTAGDSMAERRARKARGRLRNTAQPSFDKTRRARYSDYREMLDEVPELATALQVLTDFVFGGKKSHSIEITFTDNASQGSKDVVNAALRDIGGSQFFVNVFREATYLGDSFTELVYSKAGLLAERPLSAYMTDVKCNLYGQVIGYEVADTANQSSRGRNEGYYLRPVQVLHYSPDKMRGHSYGRSMWASSRKLWRQSEATEDVMSLLSILQASARKSVAYPLPSNIRPDQVDEFLSSMKSDGWSDQIFDKDGKMRRRITSLLAMDDLIYPYREGSEPPTFHNEPSANLNQLIEVLRYLQERYFISAGVPAALCGYERNVNSRATLEQQGLQFVRTVQRKQSDVVHLVQSVLLRAQAAAGMKPTLDFEVVMPPVSTFDEKLRSEIRRINAETARILGAEVGLDMRYVLKDVLGLTDDEVNMVMESAELARLSRDPADIETTTQLLGHHAIGDIVESIADLVTSGKHNSYELLP